MSSFGWTKEKHANALLHWAASTRLSIRRAREGLEADNCGDAAHNVRRGMRHWGRAKAHEDALVLGARHLPSKRVRAELDQLGWDKALRELDRLESEVNVECERGTRTRTIP